MKTIDSLGWGSTKASTFDIVGAPATQMTDPQHRWGWHQRMLMRLRERLLKHRAELAEDIETLQPVSGDTADAAADEFDHEFALSRLSVEQDVLYEIHAALARIRSGTYGRCEVTDKPISAPRLRAIPWTRFCQEVEDRLEKDGVVHPPHLGELRSVEPPPPHSVVDESETDEEEDL